MTRLELIDALWEVYIDIERSRTVKKKLQEAETSLYYIVKRLRNGEGIEEE